MFKCLSVNDLKILKKNKHINQMLKISPILLESSASAKKHEENLNNPEFRLTEVITINLLDFLIVFLIFSHLFFF